MIDGPMVCMYVRYVYKWLLYVGALPLCWIHELKALTDTYLRQYGNNYMSTVTVIPNRS